KSALPPARRRAVLSVADRRRHCCHQRQGVAGSARSEPTEMMIALGPPSLGAGASQTERPGSRQLLIGNEKLVRCPISRNRCAGPPVAARAETAPETPDRSSTVFLGARVEPRCSFCVLVGCLAFNGANSDERFRNAPLVEAMMDLLRLIILN